MFETSSLLSSKGNIVWVCVCVCVWKNSYRRICFLFLFRWNRRISDREAYIVQDNEAVNVQWLIATVWQSLNDKYFPSFLLYHSFDIYFCCNWVMEKLTDNIFSWESNVRCERKRKREEFCKFYLTSKFHVTPSRRMNLETWIILSKTEYHLFYYHREGKTLINLFL